ncbi:MAG: NADH-quinone oxidoreductase subunit L [Nitrospirae bacterium]|nr:NADH-quinone oxidoreductase subunit L [Nitrospirota bacterium]
MSSIVLIPLLPFLAFLIAGLFGRWLKERAHWVAVPAVGLSWVLSIAAFLEVAGGAPIHVTLYRWIGSGSLNVNISLYVDQLTAVMLLLVTTVSTLVHLYTVGYLHGDKGYARFFAYIALFTFSMLMLVMADNFLQLYVFWEAVGLCSYLLIAHWYERKSACNAATKAFVVNRIGDFGFGLGILLAFVTFGSLDYQTAFSAAPGHVGQAINLLAWAGGDWSVDVITLIALLLFVGAVGKSAQLPLHTWLPDAMEGPTPISALIHAATMVTAGVFLVARLNPIFNLSPVAMDVVAWTGAVTAIFAATIALTQNDIKRVVAYSTVSQLGYMMMACGVGAYAAGIFHLLTHGAFKALLFLGCGSVIHALSGEQDLRRMGGLKSAMPITYWTFLAGAIALSGIPPFAGFFSKDEILWQAFSAGGAGVALWGIGLVTAFLTAFYSFRLVFSIFHGRSRVSKEAAHHLHESPAVITIPLMVLAFLSLTAGWVGIPAEGLNAISPFLAPVLAAHEAAAPAEDHAMEYVLMLVSVAAAAGGIALAYLFYVRSPGLPARVAASAAGLYRLSFNKWYVDELYDAIIVRPTVALARGLWRGVDVLIIDGAVNGVGRVTQAWGAALRVMQSGQLQHYALFMALGAVLMVGLYLLG